MCIGIAQDKSNGGEEVTLARSVAADDNIMLGREGLDDGLVLVAVVICQTWLRDLDVNVGSPLKALYDDLLDIHLGGLSRSLLFGMHCYRNDRKRARDSRRPHDVPSTVK